MKYNEKYYIYLDELRESGVTNMFGAGVYLMREFDIDKHKAHNILGDWMETYSIRHPSSETNTPSR